MTLDRFTEVLGAFNSNFWDRVHLEGKNTLWSSYRSKNKHWKIIFQCTFKQDCNWFHSNVKWTKFQSFCRPTVFDQLFFISSPLSCKNMTNEWWERVWISKPTWKNPEVISQPLRCGLPSFLRLPASFPAFLLLLWCLLAGGSWGCGFLLSRWDRPAGGGGGSGRAWRRPRSGGCGGAAGSLTGI